MNLIEEWFEELRHCGVYACMKEYRDPDDDTMEPYYCFTFEYNGERLKYCWTSEMIRQSCSERDLIDFMAKKISEGFGIKLLKVSI